MNIPELHDNIESQIYKFKKKFIYSTKDGNIEDIVEKYEKDYDKLQYDLFKYNQTKTLWSNIEKSKFIESIILGIPLQQIIIIKTKELRWEIIDGRKRVETLYEFTRNLLKLEGLEILTYLNGFVFEDLRSRKKHIFLKTFLKYIEISSDSSEVMIDYIRKINNK